MMYRVTYSSMDASYGPRFIEADSPEEAKRRFGTCFSAGEQAVCMTARAVSEREISSALKRSEDEND